jgi:sugar (pentulose or hexulose) kinase
MHNTLDTMAIAHNHSNASPRGIAVVDVGFTNSKVILYDAGLNVLAERKITSPHHDGKAYREIDVEPILRFAQDAINDLDKILAIDTIVPSAHGACIVSLKADGSLAVPVMDYMSEPPAKVVAAYKAVMPDFNESYSPPLPMALLHAMQLFWQQHAMPHDFADTKTILPLMQYIAFGLGGRAVSEVSSISCQSHLVDMRTGKASSISRHFGWDRLYAPPAKAWDIVGQFKGRQTGFQGRGDILAGVHDSNANFLRYLAGGEKHFTLLSTGTWIIGFDTDADMLALDHSRDIVANKSVFGKTIACSRFFGGKEFEVLAGGANGSLATTEIATRLIAQGTFALPSFSDSGGPVPNSGGKGRIIGPSPNSAAERASLASLYCALMVAESLQALHSNHAVIVDGPFSQNPCFLALLQALRPDQIIWASEARDGTAAGAACLALMPSGALPHIDVAMKRSDFMDTKAVQDYQAAWRSQA